MKPVEITLRETLPAVPRAARVLLSLLSRLRHGRLEFVTPDGNRFMFEGDIVGQDATLHVRDWSVCADVLKSGDIGFAEAYMASKWDTPDLAALLELALQNRGVLEAAMRGKWWGKMLYRLRHLMRRNTRGNARRNIHAHYDLGNDFYRAWLDQTMTYSSALFGAEASLSLEDAQLAKYRRILDCLAVQQGDRVLEIGCGWGGFAEVAARERGASVHGITLSEEQWSFCSRRMRQAGLDRQVQTEICDYRDVEGQFDFVVSIEMFEAVGEAFWPGYFAAVKKRLSRGGRALIQTIVIADELFENYRRSTDFIQQYVFPGGMLPSPSAFAQQAERAGLELGECHFFGLDYAETLARWRASYNAAAPSLRKYGFDARFERLWNFYLTYCEAGFRAGSINVAQMELINA
ncbi:MAG: class I SAM-dependent methyltransferase [Betaproteobacteria bacterium]|nr:MAG: class I SAM-dependent methyltransferase [Betaproteobacteria bacterium]